jgi:type IV secretion system protein VirD4
VNKTVFVLDEYAVCGHLPMVEESVTTLRKYGVGFHFYFQDMDRIKRAFPESHQSLLANASQTFFGVSDLETSKYVAEYLGDFTLIIESGGSNQSTSFNADYGGRDSHGRSYGTNDSWQQIGRNLARHEEVRALPMRCAISFVPGIPPICTLLTPYWEQQVRVSFWNRLKIFTVAVLLLIGAAFVDIILAAY